MTRLVHAETAQQLAKYIGVIGRYATRGDKGMYVNVTIIDAKVSWGKILLQITPVAGGGTAWVVDSSITGLPSGEWVGVGSIV